jgi:hypothetical protein
MSLAKSKGTILLRSRLGIQNIRRSDDALWHTPKGLNCELLQQYRRSMLSTGYDCSLAGGGASLTQYIQRPCNTEMTGIMSDIMLTVTRTMQIVYYGTPDIQTYVRQAHEHKQ